MPKLAKKTHVKGSWICQAVGGQLVGGESAAVGWVVRKSAGRPVGGQSVGDEANKIFGEMLHLGPRRSEQNFVSLNILSKVFVLSITKTLFFGP